jgi:putative transposase
LTYYTSSRGKSGQKIFIDNSDRAYFLNLLRKQKIKKNIKFYGYVLLPNQYSFLIETYKNSLSRSMHQINSDYANYFNRRHKRRNKLFEDRYSSFIIDKKNYMAEVSSYLHLLPIKIKLAKSVFKYKWSSLPGYINREKRENWIDYDYILSMFNEESGEVSLSYQKYIKKNLRKPIESPFENLKECIILGTEDFKENIFKNQHLNRMSPQIDEDILAKKIIKLLTQSPSWSCLKVKKKKFNEAILSRNAAIYFLKKYTDLSNKQISTYFNSLKKSSISQMNRRFNLIKENYKVIKKDSDSLEKEIMYLITQK